MSAALKSRPTAENTPPGTGSEIASTTTDTRLYQWQGATLRNLVDRGRESAIVSNMEYDGNAGILIKSVASDSGAARRGLPVNAIIISANGEMLKDMAALISAVRDARRGGLRLKILTASGYIEIEMATNAGPPAFQSM